MSSYEFLERVEVYIDGEWKRAEYAGPGMGEWPHRVRVLERGRPAWSVLCHDECIRRPAA